MKIIKNDSFTGREIIISTPKGPKGIWMSPREQVVVPDSAVTNTVRNLANQRILKITNA
tara:strand:- start:468 stop:644 length:177 start_codon:yes stop_codon:yes gene_type:complete